jgi:lysyl-tRNA synthetase class II
VSLLRFHSADAIKATIQIMQADESEIKIRSSCLAAMTFTLQKLPKKLKTLSGFSIDYEPDFRQKIADSWPASIDDSFARKGWNWSK